MGQADGSGALFHDLSRAHGSGGPMPAAAGGHEVNAAPGRDWEDDPGTTWEHAWIDLGGEG